MLLHLKRIPIESCMLVVKDASYEASFLLSFHHYLKGLLLVMMFIPDRPRGEEKGHGIARLPERSAVPERSRRASGCQRA
jgi:hypothetical protein